MIEPGPYRRAFDWRVSKTAKVSIPQIATALVGLSSADHLDILEDYLTVTRKRQNNRMAMAKVQLHLVEEILVAQKSIKHYRQKMDEFKAQAGGAQPIDDNLKADMGTVERELFFHRAHANCFRAIGDGIAWRALKHDRAALRALAGNAVKQQILDQGTINELHEWSRTFDTGQGFAILNALTNWLAIGDITVIKNDGAVEVIEVKSSSADSMTKQKQRMRAVTDLLKTGKGTLEGQDAEIVRLDIAVENDLQALFGLLEEAGRSGWAGGRINNCCHIEAFDPRVFGSAEQVWKRGIEQTQKEISPWTEQDDLVIRMDSLDILSFTPNCAPFSVFPFSPRLCVELLTGARNYSCFLNLTELGREFERGGWQVENSPQELLMKDGADRDTPIFRLKRNGMHPEIPPGHIMRLAMETIRPSVFIRTLDAIFEQGPGRLSPSGVIEYDREKDLWV